MARTDSSALRYRVLAALLALAAVAIVAGMWFHGRGYYGLDPIGRVDSPDHAVLRSSGRVGHLYGIAGALLILANLLYLLRKHAHFMRGRGSLRAWMAVHVFAGLSGSALVLFHSAFQARNLIVKTAGGALVVLVITGLLGRYMYALLPHSVTGEDESPEALRARLDDLVRMLAERLATLGRGAPTVADLGLMAGERAAPTLLGAIALLPSVPLRSLRDRARIRKVARKVANAGDGVDPERRAQVVIAAREMCRVRRKLEAQAVLRNFFVWWRALHRAFALVMVLAMLVHVGVAVYYGYTGF